MAELYQTGRRMPSSSPIVTLVSGGLDSAMLLVRFARRRPVWPVYVRQGLRWETSELHWLRRFLRAMRSRSIRPLRILEQPMADVYRGHWSLGAKRAPGARSQDRAVGLPGRNVLLLAKAAVFCARHRLRDLALAPLEGNPFPDARPRFFRDYARVLSRGLQAPIRIHVPFRGRAKSSLIREGQRWPLHLTFSCVSPVGRSHCGRCNKCAERRRAFRRAEVADLTRYVYAQERGS